MIPDSPFFLIYISIRRGVTPGPVAQGHANRTGGGGFRMDGNDHSAVQSRRGERHIRAIEEGAKGSCLLFPPCSSFSICPGLAFPASSPLYLVVYPVGCGRPACPRPGVGWSPGYRDYPTSIPTRSNSSRLIPARCLMGMRLGMQWESEPVLRSSLCLRTYCR
jgi:hypothetical protein